MIHSTTKAFFINFFTCCSFCCAFATPNDDIIIQSFEDSQKLLDDKPDTDKPDTDKPYIDDTDADKNDSNNENNENNANDSNYDISDGLDIGADFNTTFDSSFGDKIVSYKSNEDAEPVNFEQKKTDVIDDKSDDLNKSDDVKMDDVKFDDNNVSANSNQDDGNYQLNSNSLNDQLNEIENAKNKGKSNLKDLLKDNLDDNLDTNSNSDGDLDGDYGNLDKDNKKSDDNLNDSKKDPLFPSQNESKKDIFDDDFFKNRTLDFDSDLKNLDLQEVAVNFVETPKLNEYELNGNISTVDDNDDTDIFDASYLNVNVVECDYVRIQFLDKISGKHIEKNIKVKDTIKFGAIYVKILKSFQNKPNCAVEYVAQIIVKEGDLTIFKNWLYSVSPATNIFEHPIYDIRIVDTVQEDAVCEEGDGAKLDEKVDVNLDGKGDVKVEAKGNEKGNKTDGVKAGENKTDEKKVDAKLDEKKVGEGADKKNGSVENSKGDKIVTKLDEEKVKPDVGKVQPDKIADSKSDNKSETGNKTGIENQTEKLVVKQPLATNTVLAESKKFEKDLALITPVHLD